MEASPVINAGSDVSIDSSTDIDFRLEFDIEKDIEGELEHFVRLARLGLSEKARNHFESTLAEDLSLFPVFAEYAEFLVADGEYAELQDLVHRDQWHEFSHEETWLVRLLATLASVALGGEWQRALDTAYEWHVEQASSSRGQQDEVHV